MEPVGDRSIILAVVYGLVAIAVLGLLGVIWLVHEGVPAEAIIAVTGIAGPAAGALAGLLAVTRTAAPMLERAKAEGYSEAVADVVELAAEPAKPARK